MTPKKEMNANERRRMYQLQKELEEETRRLINKKLLLRPNTSFAVSWKILFSFAVLFEISVQICQPLLARHKDRRTGKPLDMESILDRKLVPIRVSKLPACKSEKVFRLSFKWPVHSARTIVARILRKEATKPTRPKPYYCSYTYATLQVRSFMHCCVVSPFLISLFCTAKTDFSSEYVYLRPENIDS